MRKHLVMIAIITAALVPYSLTWAAEGEEEEPLWVGSVGMSYLSTSGNSDTTSFGLDFNAKRRPTPWGYEFFGLFSRAEDEGELTAERYYGGAKGLRSLGEKWSLFTAATGEKDRFAGFDLRTVLSAGATYTAVANDRVTLAIDGGLTYTNEDLYVEEGTLDDDSNSFMGAVLGLNFGWQFSENAKLTQLLTYFPNFDESSDWRLESVTAVEAALTDLFALRVSYDVRYRNEPLLGTDDTDTTTKASLVMKF